MLHLFRDIVSLYLTPVKNEYGKDVFVNSTDYHCRFVEKTKVILSPTGENITSQAEVWLAPGVLISLGDKLVYATQGYRVIQLSKPKDSTSVRFIKCFLERYEA